MLRVDVGGSDVISVDVLRGLAEGQRPRVVATAPGVKVASDDGEWSAVWQAAPGEPDDRDSGPGRRFVARSHA